MTYRNARKLIGAGVVALAVTAVQLSAPVATAAPGGGNGKPIPDRYIVVFDKGVPKSAVTAATGLAKKAGGKVHYTYDAALNGFAATLPSAALNALRGNKLVASIEQDRTISLTDTQVNPPWGLDRIDQRNLPLNQSYTYNATGAGVKAYIIDTGMRLSHSQFTGRAINGYDAIDGGTADDCNGHGTHVAGTVGGTTYGAAKGVTLVAVRVLNCQGSGTISQVIAGIDWVTSNHSTGPAVANMSLGGSSNSALDTAVRNSIADGVTYSIAAGNSNANACNSSPSRVAEGITVGATSNTDARASFSNYGTCLDIFAPGVNILSAWYNSDTATNTISGTSMAAPHAAGAAALYLQGTPGATPQQVRDQLVNTATTGVVTNPGSGSPNRLLYTLGGTSPPPPPPPPPPPSGCSSYPQVFTGSLAGAGDTDYHPSPYYYSSVSGAHKGCLDGPSGVDFDLYLQKWNGWFWADVASGTSSLPDETVTYNGTAGYYRWEVYSYSGTGSYTFGMSKP